MSLNAAVEVDASDVLRALDEVKRALPGAADVMAEVLRDALAEESSVASRRLGDSWTVAPGDEGPVVSSDLFWAHFLAGGTQPHGPRTADRLVFRDAGGGFVAPDFVSGISAVPFEPRAIEAAERRADDVIRDLLADLDRP